MLICPKHFLMIIILQSIFASKSPWQWNSDFPNLIKEADIILKMIDFPSSLNIYLSSDVIQHAFLVSFCVSVDNAIIYFSRVDKIICANTRYVSLLFFKLYFAKYKLLR